MGYCEEYVDKEYVAEMRGVARVLDAPEEEVVLANLYYDALKFLLGQGSLGCTGFSAATQGAFRDRVRNLPSTSATLAGQNRFGWSSVTGRPPGSAGEAAEV
jgi:hypothetical protein